MLALSAKRNSPLLRKAFVRFLSLDPIIGAASNWIMKISDTRDRSLASAVKKVKAALNKPCEPPEMRIQSLPIIHRLREERLVQVIANPNASITLLVGPSRSGKSALLGHLVHGRPATVYFVGREMKSDMKLPYNIAVLFGLGDFVDNFGKDFGFTLSAIKLALVEFKRENATRESPRPIPFLIFDDIYEFVEPRNNVSAPSFQTNADILASWALEMVSQQLLKLMMITSETHMIAVLKMTSGFSARMNVMEHFSPVDKGELLRILCERWQIHETVATHVVNQIGGNMGDLEAIAHELPVRAEDRSLTQAENDTKYRVEVEKAIEEQLSILIERGMDELRALYSITSSTDPAGVLVRHYAFLLLDHTRQPFSIVQLSRFLAEHDIVMPAYDINRVLTSLCDICLLACSIHNSRALYDYHRPRYYISFKELLAKSEDWELFVGEAVVNFKEKRQKEKQGDAETNVRME